MKGLRETKGVTLIALVITIIVLLILAGVALSMIMGDSGIFGKANKANELTKRSQALEDVRLLILEAQTEASSDGKKATLVDVINQIEKSSNTYIVTRTGSESAKLLDNKIKDEVTEDTPEIYVVNLDFEVEVKIDSNLKIEVTNAVVDTSRDKYIISYNAGDGTGVMENTTIYEGEEKELRLNEFTKENYTFDGWIDGDGNAYSDGQIVSITKNIYLTAQWKETEYTLTYNANGGNLPSGTDSTKVLTINSQYGQLPTPTRTNYTFIGWYTDQVAGTQVSSSNTITNDTIIYARWRIPNTTQVKCYADIDENGTVDGVIYCDLLAQGGTSGSWGSNGQGSWSLPSSSAGSFKGYYISQESYTTTEFGTHPVLSYISGTSGNVRFYVLALSNDEPARSYPGASYSVNGWSIPTKHQWSILGSSFGVTGTNYQSYGFNWIYWSSTAYDSTITYSFHCSGGIINAGNNSSNSYYVRLGRLF